MKFFAEKSGNHTMEEIVSGVERDLYLYNFDAICGGNEDLYLDRANIETAVFSLVKKNLLKTKSEDETRYCTKITWTHLRNRVRVALAKTRWLLKLGHVWKPLMKALVMSAAAVTIASGLIFLLNQ